MRLVPAKCENCGGALEVDPSLKAAICPCCYMPYVVQDAINHYYNHNHIHIHSDVINHDVDKRASEAQLVAGDTCMKQEQYDSALKAYKDVCESTPQNYLAWWGQIRAITHNFTLKPESKSDLLRIKLLFSSATVVATPEQRKELDERYKSYYVPLEKKSEAEREQLNKRIAHLTAEYNRLSPFYRKYDKSYRNYYKRGSWYVPFWLTLILAGLTVIELIPVFTGDVSLISLPVIFPVAAWLVAQFICMAVNSHVNSCKNKMYENREQVSQEMNRIDGQRKEATERLSALER